MSAGLMFLKRAEDLGLLKGSVVAQLRKQVTEAKGPVTAETLAKLLVQKKLLTVAQAKQLVGEVAAARQAEKARKSAAPEVEGLTPLVDDDLGLLEDTPAPSPSRPAAAPSTSKPQPVDDLMPLEDEGLELLEDPAPPAPAPSPAPASRSAEKKKPKKEAAEPVPEATAGLEPLEQVDLLDAGGLSPLDEALGDPLSDPLTEVAATPAANPMKPAKKPRSKNPWDSALIYVGGGTLAVLIFLFVVLYWSLSSGSANDAFQLAEADYQSQAYSQAIAKYEKFLDRFGSDANASLARVRIGICQIRLAVDQGRSTSEALSVTEETLKKIEAEEKFDEARTELADILPRIAELLAQQAKRAINDVEKASVLVKDAERAVELARDGAYIPPGLRTPVESKLSLVQEDISQVKRELNRDAELKQALAEMTKAVEESQTAEAFAIRNRLLDRYPGLNVNPLVVEATLAVAAKERELVKVVDEALAPAEEEAAPVVEEITLVEHGGDPIDAPAGATVAMTLAGSVYGLDAATGKPLWRRFVGLDGTSPPVRIGDVGNADYLAIDPERQSLVRIKGSDGSVAWQLPVGEPFAPPAIVGDKLIVSTHSGKLLEVDAASGASARRVVLPQGARASAAFDANRPHFYQLGEHSNLFVISSDTLACSQAYFLGHFEGAVAAPPVAVGGQVFVALNIGSDYSMLHVLSADADGTSLQPKRDPQRLRGHVVTPPVIDGRRVYVFTNLGAVHCYNVDPANVNQPVTELAKIVASRKSPLVSYGQVVNDAMWIGADRLTMYELLPAKKDLASRWSRFDGDVTLAAPVHVGNAIVHARYRRAAGHIAIAAVDAKSGTPRWQATLAAPVLSVDGMAVNANGSVFRLDDALAGNAAAAAARVSSMTDPPQFTRALTSEQRIVLASEQGEPQWGVVESGQTPAVTLVQLREPNGMLAGPAAVLGSGVLLPLSSGRIELADAATGKPLLFPFQGRLEADRTFHWQTPLILRSTATPSLAIADDRGRLYLIEQKETPQPHLALVQQADAKVVAGTRLAQHGDGVVAVVEREGGNALQAFAFPGLTPQGTYAVKGGVAFGPESVGDALVVVTDEQGLVLLDADLKEQWALPLEGANLVGAPIEHDGQLIAVTTRGEVLVIDDGTGEVVSRVATRRPLAAAPVVQGAELVFPGADGAVYRLPLSALKG